MRTYRCRGALLHHDDDAIILFSHALDEKTGDVSLVGKTVIVPWSSIPRWIASMHDSLSGIGLMSGMIPFVAYISKEGSDVRVTFCQPETIRKSIVESVDGPIQVVTERLGLGSPEPFVAIPRFRNRSIDLRDFEETIRTNLESYHAAPDEDRRIFEGKPDMILKAEIFSRKTA